MCGRAPHTPQVVVATAVASPTEAVKATAPAPPQPAVKPAQDTAATSEEATNQEADAKKLVSQMVQSAMAAAVSKQDDMVYRQLGGVSACDSRGGEGEREREQEGLG